MDKLALQAAKALGRGGLPSDAEAQQLLKKAASAYAFEF